MKAQVLRTIAAVALAATVAASVQAQDRNEGAQQVRVAFGFSAADLTTERGARAVYRELNAKAYRACRRPGVNPIALSLDRDCMRRLVDDVVEQVGSPILTALHDGSSYEPQYMRTAAVEPR